MTLAQLKAILRAASELTGQPGFYVIGSAAILHIIETPKHRYLARSNEADLIALSGDPEAAEQIGVILGELSPFHDNHDVYADGVTFETPEYAPAGWRDRAVAVRYDDIGVTAHFMELHDLVLSKIGAGRPKDMEFCQALAETGYVNHPVLMERLPMVNCTDEQGYLMEGRVKRCFPAPLVSAEVSPPAGLRISPN